MMSLIRIGLSCQRRRGSRRTAVSRMPTLFVSRPLCGQMRLFGLATPRSSTTQPSIHARSWTSGLRLVESSGGRFTDPSSERGKPAQLRPAPRGSSCVPLGVSIYPRYVAPMNSGFIAWIVAIALGVTVVGLGWRRKLADTTRNWLPRFGEASEPAAVPTGPSDVGQRRRPLSPRQRRWIVWGYLLLSLCNAVLALFGADGRLFYALIATLWALSAVALFLKKWPPSVDGSIS